MDFKPGHQVDEGNVAQFRQFGQALQALRLQGFHLAAQVVQLPELFRADGFVLPLTNQLAISIQCLRRESVIDLVQQPSFFRRNRGCARFRIDQRSREKASRLDFDGWVKSLPISTF